MLKVTNIAKVFDQLDAFAAKGLADGEKAAKGMAYEALELALEVSAQSTGDFAANWNLSMGHPDTTFVKFGGARAQYQIRDAPALMEARSKNSGKLGGFVAGTTIFLSNAAAHDQAYAVLIEEGKIKNYRTVNAGAGAPIAKAAGVLATMYPRLSPAQIMELGSKIQ